MPIRNLSKPQEKCQTRPRARRQERLGQPAGLAGAPDRLTLQFFRTVGPIIYVVAASSAKKYVF